MQGGNLGLWKSGCSQSSHPSFPGCSSTSLPHHLTREWWDLHPSRRRDFTPCLLEGQLGTEGGCLQSALAAHHPAFNRLGRTFLWTAFLKELTEDFELCSDYVSFDSERINLHLGRGQQMVRSVLYSVFSKQTGQDDSLRWQREEREYMHISWIPSSIPSEHMSGMSVQVHVVRGQVNPRHNKSRHGWEVPLVLNCAGRKLLSCCVTPGIKCVGCRGNSSEARVADALRKEKKERLICIGVHGLPTRH